MNIEAKLALLIEAMNTDASVGYSVGKVFYTPYYFHKWKNEFNLHPLTAEDMRVANAIWKQIRNRK